MPVRKRLQFRGSALADLREFPDGARHEAGYQLDKVQLGRELTDWKPMKTVGAGVKEIGIKDSGDAYRVLSPTVRLPVTSYRVPFLRIEGAIGV
jgi:phage-related protein